MRNLLSIDSKLFSILSRVTDLIILSVLWILCSIPIVTVGVSTTALYYVTLKMARRDDVHVFRMFFRAIKDNFKQGISITCVLLILSAILFLDYRLLTAMEGIVVQTVAWILFPVSLLFVMTMFYVFPLQSQYINSVPQTIKNAFILAWGNIPFSILIVIINMIPVLLLLFAHDLFVRLLPILVFISPAGIAYLCSFCYVKIFASVEVNKENVQSDLSSV